VAGGVPDLLKKEMLYLENGHGKKE